MFASAARSNWRHFRIASDDAKTKLGLPEIKIGIFPGAGGTQRVARLMPTGDALLMMMKGEALSAEAALKANLVHAVAGKGDLVAYARQWIAEGGSPVQPWDRDGFRLPSGPVHSKAGMMVWPAANAICRRETFDNYPAAKALLKSVYEGLQVPMDTGLRIESRSGRGASPKGARARPSGRPFSTASCRPPISPLSPMSIW